MVLKLREEPRAMTSHTAILTRHPETHTDAVRGIEARVSRTDGGALAFTYTLKGDLSRIRIPAPREPRRADRLWEQTCFEAFVSGNNKPEYYELNFALSGEWALYAFRRYRERAGLVEGEPAPTITVRETGDSFELDAAMGLDRLPMIGPGARIRLALSAVIEDDRGMLSYWALKHPSGKPDFHHPDGFALELEPPGRTIIRR